MAETIDFELVSPERLLISGAVEMVVVPGSEGDFGALAGHAATVSALRPGVVAVFEGGAVTSRVFVAGGFAEVTPERCTVLADEAVPLDQIDRGAVEKSIADFRDDVSVARNDAEREAALAALEIAEAKLAVLAAPIY